MDCSEARAGVWPPERPRLASRDVTRAREHIAGCAECKEYFEQDRMLLDAYDRIRRDKAPRRVRERVFDVLARERAGLSLANDADVTTGWKRLAPLLAAAAVAVVALGTTVIVTTPDPAPASGDAMFVEDYVRRAVGADHIETSDAGEVQRFLTRELGVPLSPLRHAGLELERVEICLLEGRRGAMIVYKRQGEVISHYVVPRAMGDERAPAVGESLHAGDGGPSVITWASASLEQALVSDVPSRELMELARTAATVD
jgi:hypothetical protein